MIYYTGISNEDYCKFLSRECHKIKVPEPLDFATKTRYVFNWKKHPELDSFMLIVNDKLFKVHPLTKLIAKANGDRDNLIEEDIKIIIGYFKNWDLTKYRTKEGLQPFEKIEDIIEAVSSYWQNTVYLYPNESQRESVRQKFLTLQKVLLSSIIPEQLEEKTREEVKNQGWF